jgi:hypothetical protein
MQWQAPSSIPVSGSCIDLLQHILVPEFLIFEIQTPPMGSSHA